jgi:hypothetical protein
LCKITIPCVSTIDIRLARNNYTFDFVPFSSFCYVKFALLVIILFASANFLFIILQLDHVDVSSFSCLFYVFRTFNIFQVYQYFTIYRWYFLLKFEQFSWIRYTCTTHFKVSRYQRPFWQVKVPGTTPYWKACVLYFLSFTHLKNGVPYS